jgi:two-component system OmpR family response regulator
MGATAAAPAEGPLALLVDADAALLAGPALHMLRQNGVAIDHAATPDAALAAIAERRYALVLLEVAEAAFDGSDLCQRIVAVEGPPVMIWSRQAELLDRVAGLELGADDFVSKHAHPLELLARTRAMLRRRRTYVRSSEPELEPGSWMFDAELNSVSSWRGARSWLTPATAALLRHLCARPRTLVSRDEIVAQLSDGDLAPRTVDIFVSRLRRSLAEADEADRLIRTAPRKGYLLDASVTDRGGRILLRLQG